MFDTSQVHLGMSRNRISAGVNGMLQRFNDLLRALANLVRHAQVTGHSNTLALAVSAVLAQGEGARRSLRQRIGCCYGPLGIETHYVDT